jgi:uncharacterized circularly permuted ATP-grasp superfamily protein
VGQASFSFDDSSPAAAALSRAAPVRAGQYDELRSDAGHLRPAWQAFFDAQGSEGLADLDRRVQALRRQIRDDGITYNVYSDASPDSPARPWSLDLLPFVISAADWAQIERGVTQRAAMLSQMLHDLYGPQQLMAEGLLPPALLFGHPGYLRPLVGVKPVGGTYLQIAAFDLARAPDGRWWVVSQRTQAPSGLGYALQNRLIVGRQFPEAFRALHVQRMASSFRRLLDTVTRAAPKPDSAAEGGWRAAHRPADAGALQRDLLRARLPGPLPRRAAGRRRRPHGARRPRVPEDRAWPGAGPRDPAPAR